MSTLSGIETRARRLHEEAVRIAEENDAEINPLFTPAPVCMSTYEAAAVATDTLKLVERVRTLEKQTGDRDGR